VLLVEDDHAHAEITRRHLDAARPAPGPLVHLSDGQSALDYLRQEGAFADGAPAAPDVVLLDLRLPKVSGLEVLRLVKQDARLRSIPVVVLTTSRAPSDIQSAYEHGASSYLVKPMVAEEFAELMAVFVSYWLGWNEQPG
jgi:CheY-like chemotaxis protein